MIKKKDSHFSDFGEARNGKTSIDVINNITHSIPDKNKTVKMQTIINVVGSLIPTGRRNAVHVKEIERIAGYDARHIRKAIEALRLKGILICGDDAGLYHPEDMEELRAWEMHRTATARAIYRTTAAARRTLKKYNDPDQLTLDDMGLL